MEVFWGERLTEETRGLDILGIRGLDQALETALANGITTISQRGRYLTILPWTIGEYFDADRSAGADRFLPERFAAFVGRVEFLTLAASTLDETPGATSGLLGSVVHRPAMDALRAGETIAFPATLRSSIMGTYFGPCRAIGLVDSTSAGAAQPFLLTPRGVELWRIRGASLEAEYARDLLWHAEALTPDDVQTVIPHFSLGRLAHANEEAACLRRALEVPWEPAGGGDSVAQAYQRFGGTLGWLRAQGRTAPLRADDLLAANLSRVATEGDADPVRASWAEFEWRRRLHFALELLFSAVSSTLGVRREATPGELVSEWMAASEDVPPLLAAGWPEARHAWMRTTATALATVPGAFALEPVSAAWADLSPHARALTAFALLVGLSRSGRVLRATGKVPDRRGLGETALSLLEGGGDTPFGRTLTRLAEITVEAHLSTTFRKMAAGQKCSLRFFPDGPRLRTTGVPTSAGWSGSRLGNLIRILADAGVEGVAA